MKALVALVLALVMIQGAYAAATIADIYTAASEAETLGGSSISICQNVDPTCSDEDYTATDAYTKVGDGSTAVTSAVAVQDKGNSQTAILKVVYDVNEILSGTYKLRLALIAPEPFNFYVCTYINDTHVNTSSCENFTTTNIDTWFEVDVDTLIRESMARFNQRIILRFVVEDKDDGLIEKMSVSEIYLKRPFKPADFTILAQGVNAAEVGTRVENTWNIVSVSAIPDITNASCKVEKLIEINESENHEEINISSLDIEYEVSDDNTYFKVYWDTNESAGIVEGYNYELECQGYIGDLHIESFSQFVYINRERTLFDFIEDIVAYLLQLIGLAEENNEILKSLQLELEIGATEYLPGDPGKIFSKILQDNVELEGVACAATVHYPDGTEFISGVIMEPIINTAAAAQSYFSHDFIVPEVIGVYPVTVACSLNATETFYTGPPTITINTGSYDSGANTDLAVRDNIYYSFSEQAKEMDVEFEFTGLNVSNTTTLLSFHFDAQRLFGGSGDPATDSIRLSLYNYTSASWVEFATPYTYTSNVFPFTQSINQEEGLEDFVSGGGNIIIRLTDTDGPPTDNSVNTQVDVDRVTVSTVDVGGIIPVDLIKSSSEVHVSPPPIEMDLSEGIYFTGQTAVVSNVLYWSNAPSFSQYSFIADTQCFLALHYPNGTSWQILEMNSTGGGVYVVDVTFPEITGNYIARASCQGGALPKLARDSSTLIVTDGVRMEMISR